MSFLRMLFIVLLAMASSDSLAERGYYYAGLKTGVLAAGFSGFDNAYPLGVRVGYDYGRRWSLEVDFLTSNLTQGFELTEGGLSDELDVSTQALNVAYRSETPYYYIIRFGIIDHEIDPSPGRGLNPSNTSFAGVNTTSFSIGSGAGYRLSEKVSLEFEYTYLDSEVDFFGFTIQRRLWSKKTPW